MKNKSVDQINKYCASNHIKCLESPQTQQTSCRWLCLLHNMEFQTNFKNIKTRNSRCVLCQHDKVKNTFTKIGKQFNLETICAFLVREHPNGLCLSTNYNNSQTKMTWQCDKGHVWNATANSIMSAGTWCPECSKNATEQKVRTIFESILNKPFLSVRPDCLKNPDTGRNLELDGYCEELKLAFEYDGRLHYEDRSTQDLTEEQIRRHGSLETIRRNDQLKDQLCKSAGITLVRIPYWEKDNLESFISQSLKNKENE